MKRILLLLWLLPTVVLAQKSPVRVYFTLPSVGVGLSGKPSEMISGGLAGMASATVELRNNWNVHLELTTVGFRTPAYQQKTGFIIYDYPRLRHETLGMRIGRNLVMPNSKFLLRPSAGINYDKIGEPFYKNSSWFGPVYDYHTVHTFAIPVQLDVVYRLYPPNQTAFVLSSRWNPLSRWPYGIVSLGLQLDFLNRYRTTPTNRPSRI